MEATSGNSKSGPLIPRRTLYLSLSLAAVTEVLWVAAQILHRPADPTLFIMTLGWPFYYAICLGMAFGLAWTVKTGGIMGRDYVPYVFRFLAPLFPRLPVKRILDMVLTLAARFALFAFSLLFAAMGGLLCYLEVMHPEKVHP